jgi:hypothetical protein
VGDEAGGLFFYLRDNKIGQNTIGMRVLDNETRIRYMQHDFIVHADENFDGTS